MARKAAEPVGCALCGAKDVTEPRGDERYCRDCWDKKIAVEDIVAREFTLKRYIRAHSAEKYLVYHSTQKRPVGQLVVLDDGFDLFLTLLLYPTFVWEDEAYHLEKDPEHRTFGEILVDVVAADVIEPWGGGKWHLEVFRATAAEPEDWNGELWRARLTSDESELQAYALRSVYKGLTFLVHAKLSRPPRRPTNSRRLYCADVARSSGHPENARDRTDRRLAALRFSRVEPDRRQAGGRRGPAHDAAVVLLHPGVRHAEEAGARDRAVRARWARLAT